MLLRLLLLCVCVLILNKAPPVAAADGQHKAIYIVNLGRPLGHEGARRTHYDMLAAVVRSKQVAAETMLYTYAHGLNGFAAHLTAAQAKILSKMKNVVSVTPSQTVKAHTTYSWKFLGLNPNTGLWPEAKLGEDVIVGVLDTGIWPEAASFDDKEMPPVPNRWNGICQQGQNFTPANCNRKIIGARWFNRAYKLWNNNFTDYESPRDIHGHGTHVASTVAGREVQAKDYGIARGVAPLARIAVYKVLWGADGEGSTADILAAMDAAIQDKVDIMSMSISYSEPFDLGSFYATEKGILVVASAGNYGPYLGTVGNTSPWVFTIAAGTMNRGFHAQVILGNNQTIKAVSVSKVEPAWHSIIWAEHASVDSSNNCGPRSLNATLVQEKYVLCDGVVSCLDASQEIKRAGGLGLICKSRLHDLSDHFDVPTFLVKEESAIVIRAYTVFEAERPVIYVTTPQTVYTDLAPVVAWFSSRGPASLSDILKPDITAPGVNILAAVRKTFEFMSGTSMSCPHVSGLVALLKSVHPAWSPSAIKSALMTTASVVDSARGFITDQYTGQESNPFGYGAGHVNPPKAADPGLVYDTTPEEYAMFLCLQLTRQQVSPALRRAFSCPSVPPAAYDLNYPSITISSLDSSKTVKRRVTNVGVSRNATYRVSVEKPSGVMVEVVPEVLQFSQDVEELGYQVTFTPMSNAIQGYVFGSLTWSDGEHQVRSPIVLHRIA